MPRSPETLADLRVLKSWIETWQADAVHGLPCTMTSLIDARRLVGSIATRIEADSDEYLPSSVIGRAELRARA